MNPTSKSIGRFLFNQRLRVSMLLAAAAITVAGWCWMSLENKTIWLGTISPSGEKFISYTYNEISRSGWQVSTQVRDVETGKVLHDLSRFPFSWSKSIAWVDDVTLVATVIAPDATQSGDKLEIMTTIRLGDELSVLDQKRFVNQRPTSLRITSDGEAAYAIVENDNTIQPRYIELCKTPLVGDVDDDKSRVLSRLEFGNDEQAFCSRATHTNQDTLVVDVAPVRGATPPGDFVLTDGVNKTTLLIDMKSGEVLHEVRGGYETIRHPQSTDFLSEQTPTGIDVRPIDNDSKVVATFQPKYGGLLDVLAFGDRWRVIREETPSHITFQVMDGFRNTTKELRFTDWRSHVFLSGTNLFAISDGKLDRFDLEELDHRTQLVDVRPFVRIAAVSTVLGIPLAVLVVLVGLVRSASRETFFDVVFACMLASVSFSIWGQADIVRNYEAFFLSMAFAFLGAGLSVLLVWTFSSKAIYSTGLPLITLALAATILLGKIAWSDHGGAEMAFVGFSLLVLFQSIGHILLRRFGARLVAGDGNDTTQTQFSVRQVGVFTAAFAVLLVCLRLMSFREPAPASAFVWMVLFAGAYSASVNFAQWSALRMKSVLPSLLLCLTGTIVALCCVDFVNHSTMLNRGIGRWSALQIYAQPLIAAVVVWTTVKIARRAGYRSHHAIPQVPCRNVAY